SATGPSDAMGERPTSGMQGQRRTARFAIRRPWMITRSGRASPALASRPSLPSSRPLIELLEQSLYQILPLKHEIAQVVLLGACRLAPECRRVVVQKIPEHRGVFVRQECWHGDSSC